MKNVFYAVLLILAFVTVTNCVYADSNSFFGANPGSGSGNSGNSGSNQDYTHDSPDDSNPNAVLPGLNETTPAKPSNNSDFTGDEKRMQKKYKSNIANAEHLIIRGTDMMKAAGDDVNSPIFKKGKILKEIGEKSLADLKANSPFPDQKTK
jgi:hypothetical protein